MPMSEMLVDARSYNAALDDLTGQLELKLGDTPIDAGTMLKLSDIGAIIASLRKPQPTFTPGVDAE